MSKVDTNVSTLKINRGTYAKIVENIESISENELIILQDKAVPIPSANDNGKVIKVNASGEYELGADSSGMSNPMTSQGDIITGGSSGTPQRLAKGSDGQVLKMVSGSPAWANESGGGGTQLYKHQLTITSEGGDTNLILSFINNVSTSYSGSVLAFTPLIICDGWAEGEFDEGNDSIYGVVTHFEIYENNFNSNFTVKGFFEIGSAGNVFTWNGALGIGSSIITDIVTPL